MNITYPLLLSSLAGLSTMIGCIFIYFKIKNTNKFIVFCLSLSLTIMLLLSIFDLMKEAFTYFLLVNKLINYLLIIIIFILGIILVKFIDNKISNDYDKLYNLGILNMIALILHNIPEGIITFIGSIHDPSLGLRLSIAILLHNIPEGISIAIPIYYATRSKKRALLYTFISGLSEPLSGLLGYLLIRNYLSYTLICYLLVLVSGIMITIAIDQLLPKCLNYHENKSMCWGFIIGLMIMIFNLIIL